MMRALVESARLDALATLDRHRRKVRLDVPKSQGNGLQSGVS